MSLLITPADTSNKRYTAKAPTSAVQGDDNITFISAGKLHTFKAVSPQGQRAPSLPSSGTQLFTSVFEPWLLQFQFRYSGVDRNELSFNLHLSLKFNEV